MIVIDGKELIVGRAATVIAKKALLGETIRVVNCDQMLVTGSKAFLVQENHRRRVQGTWSKGPFYFRMPDRYVRRVIRGMLPHTTARGKQAYSRILCYIGFPDEFKNEKLITIETANVKKVKNLKYMTVIQLSKLMGAKV